MLRRQANPVWRGLAIAVCLACAGCKTFSGMGPIPKAVATCQQLSLSGRSAMERGEWEQAEKDLQQAVQTCSNNVEARQHYAEALWHRGAEREAIAQLEAAQRLDRDDNSLTIRLGEMYLTVGSVYQARSAAEQALDFDPRSASAWALHGRSLQATNDLRGALSDYQRSIGYAPESTDVLTDMAEIYRRLGQPERALVTLQSLLDTYSPGEEPQRALYLQGLALVALGRYEHAIDSLREAAARDRPTAEILCRLGEAQLLAGRQADACGSLQQALAIDPAHTASRELMQRSGLANAPTAGVNR